MDKLILDYVYEHEEHRSKQLFLTQPIGHGQVRNFTWGETMDEARRMAAYLESLGYERGARIAILSKNSAYFVIAELAIWMAGYTTVAIFPTETPATVQYVLEHSDASLLFVGGLDAFDQQAQAVPAGMPCIALPFAPRTGYLQWDEIITKTEPITGNPRRTGDELMFIVYTSGSTGTPKGVMHSFEGGTRASEGLARETYGLPSTHGGVDYRVLSYLPLAHIFERAVVECASLVLGCTQIFFNENLETFRADLLRARPTLFISVPRLWLKFQQGVLAEIPQRKLDVLLSLPIISTIVKRKILKKLGLDQVVEAGTGSAPTPVSVLAWYRRLGLNLSEGLGMTEDFLYSHISRGPRAVLGSVGQPHPGVQRQIAPDGELLLRSPGTFVGYYKRPDLDAEAFTEDGFFCTGDLAEIDAEGNLKLIGRKKEIFKTAKGKFVAPVPIETIINEHEMVEFSIVTGVGQAAAFAVVVPTAAISTRLGESEVKRAFETEMADILKRINAAVADHERLHMIVVSNEPWTIENGCLTPTLKIKRSGIEARLEASVDSWFAKREAVVWA
ncbi:AMP-binding protein [Pseudomonas aeruginosa]